MSNRTSGRTPARDALTPVRGRDPEPPASAEHRSPSVALQASDAEPASITVVRGDPPEHLFRHLLSAYLRGSRSFVIVETPRLSARTREVALEFCRRTRQPAVTRETASRLELDDRDGGETGTLEERLVRLGELVIAFHREAVESWGKLPFGDDRFWERKDDDVDREAWYLERCIAIGDGSGTGQPHPTIGAYTIARSLERIADHAVTLGEVGPRLTTPAVDGGRLRELRQYHGQAMEHLGRVLHTPDGSRANDLLDVGEALVAGGRALSERLLPAVGDGSMSPASAAAVARALEAISRTVAYSQDIAQAFIDRSVRPVRPLVEGGALASVGTAAG